MLYMRTRIEKIILNKQLIKTKFTIEVFQKILAITNNKDENKKFDVATNAIVNIEESKKKILIMTI